MKNYGVLKLTATSPAQVLAEPITLAEAKAYLRIPAYSPADTAADDLLESLIEAAREMAEMYQNRPLAGAQYDLTMDTFPAGSIELTEGLSSVDAITYKDDAGATATLAEGVDYVVDAVRGLVIPATGESWPTFTPWPSGAVTIRFTVDPPALPKLVKAGLYMLISHWWDQRQVLQPGAQEFREIPHGVTACLSTGARPRSY